MSPALSITLLGTGHSTLRGTIELGDDLYRIDVHHRDTMPTSPTTSGVN